MAVILSMGSWFKSMAPVCRPHWLSPAYPLRLNNEQRTSLGNSLLSSLKLLLRRLAFKLKLALIRLSKLIAIKLTTKCHKVHSNPWQRSSIQWRGSCDTAISCDPLRQFFKWGYMGTYQFTKYFLSKISNLPTKNSGNIAIAIVITSYGNWSESGT